GDRPPVFVEKWADGVPSTSGIDPVQERLNFNVYAKVVDPDSDLNKNSVYAQLSIWFGTGNACEQPQKMRDDGVAPDRVANDGIFTLGGTVCTIPSLFWDGSIILFNATDLKGHASNTRFVLSGGHAFVGQACVAARSVHCQADGPEQSGKCRRPRRLAGHRDEPGQLPRRAGVRHQPPGSGNGGDTHGRDVCSAERVRRRLALQL